MGEELIPVLICVKAHRARAGMYNPDMLAVTLAHRLNPRGWEMGLSSSKTIFCHRRPKQSPPAYLVNVHLLPGSVACKYTMADSTVLAATFHSLHAHKGLPFSLGTNLTEKS